MYNLFLETFQHRKVIKTSNDTLPSAGQHLLLETIKKSAKTRETIQFNAMQRMTWV